jgi:hypothetical protein
VKACYRAAAIQQQQQQQQQQQMAAVPAGATLARQTAKQTGRSLAAQEQSKWLQATGSATLEGNMHMQGGTLVGSTHAAKVQVVCNSRHAAASTTGNAMHRLLCPPAFTHAAPIDDHCTAGDRSLQQWQPTCCELRCLTLVNRIG